MSSIHFNSKVNVMTDGNILRHILLFALPMFVGNLFQQVYSVVDTMVAGYTLGDAAIAAIGASGAVYGLMMNLAMGMNGGFTVIVTQAVGAGDKERVKKSIAATFLLNAIIASFATFVAAFGIPPLLLLLDVPQDIFDDARMYIGIICGGILITTCYNMSSSILRGMGNSKAPLWFLIIACLINIVLDIAFVRWMGFGVDGLAWATVLAQLVAAALSGIYLFRTYPELMPSRSDYRLQISLMKEMLYLGFTMGMTFAIINFGYLFTTKALNALGSVAIAGNNIGCRIPGILMQVMASVAAATATFTSQNWGAGRRERIRTGLRVSILFMEVWSIVCIILQLVCGEGMIRLLTGTSNEEVLKYAMMMSNAQFFFFPVLGVLIVFRSAMQAIGWKMIPVLSSCLELGMQFLSAYVLIPRMGYLGVCVSTAGTWTLMAIFLTVAYYTKNNRIYSHSPAPICTEHVCCQQ